MKQKRILSLLVALAMAHSLLPTGIAFASESPAEEASAAQESILDEAVTTVQKMIDALPSASDASATDYDAVQAAYDAYDALTDGQKEQVRGADAFEALFEYFNAQAAPADNTEIEYITAGGTTEKTTDYTVLTSQADVTASGILYVEGSVTVTNRLVLNDDATIILAEGALLTVGGIYAEKALTITTVKGARLETAVVMAAGEGVLSGSSWSQPMGIWCLGNMNVYGGQIMAKARKDNLTDGNGYGIYVSGTLTVDGSTAGAAVAGYGGGFGIYAGTLIAANYAYISGFGGDTTDPDTNFPNTSRSTGISANVLKVSNCSQVQGEGGKVSADASKYKDSNKISDAGSIGIEVGEFEVDNAYLGGTGGEAAHTGDNAESIGICCSQTNECKITNNSTVSAAGGTATGGAGKSANSYGISVPKLTVDGSTLEARTGTGKSAADVYSSGTFTLKNGATLKRTYNRGEDLSKVLVNAKDMYVGDSAKAYDCAVKLMEGSKITGTLGIYAGDGKTLAELLPDDCTLSNSTLSAATVSAVTISNGHTCTYDDDAKCTCGRMKPVNYKDENGKTQTVTTYTLVKSGDNFTPATGWYVAEDAEIENTISPQENADVKLILCDGKVLTAKKGINGTTASLTVYGQAAGTGALNTGTFSKDGDECDICLNSLKTAGGKINADKASRVSINGDMTVSGGSVTLGKSEIKGNLAAASGAALAAVLADEYAYYSGNKWYESVDLQGINTLGNVNVRQIPLKSASLTADKVSYTYGDDVVLTMSVTTTSATVTPAAVQYEYYKKVDGGYELQHREDGKTEYRPGKLAAGTYTYKCVVEYGGYTIKDTAEFTVNNAAFDKAEIKQKGTLTYTGADQQIAVEADIKTKNNEAFAVTYSKTQNGTYGAELPSFKNAGDYTVYYKITAANHESAEGSFAVKINPAPITPSIRAEDKPYDGTTDVTVTVSFAELKGGDALVNDTDYEVTAAFVDASVGKNKAVTATVTLKDTALASNYELARNTCECAAEIKPLSTSSEGLSIDSFSPMTYTGEPQIPVAEVKIGNLTVTGSWSAVTNTYDKTTFTASGNFTGTIDNKDAGMARARLTPNPEKTTAAKILRGNALSAAEVTYGEFFGVDGNAVAGDFAWMDSIDAVNETTTARMSFTEKSGNYEVAEFDVTVSVYTLGGGSGGSGTKKNNLDGSTTTTKTDKKRVPLRKRQPAETAPPPQR